MPCSSVISCWREWGKEELASQLTPFVLQSLLNRSSLHTFRPARALHGDSSDILAIYCTQTASCATARVAAQDLLAAAGCTTNEGEDNVCGLPFTTVRWCLEKGDLGYSSCCACSANTLGFVLPPWHPFISTWKPHKCNPVCLTLETLKDATPLPSDFFLFRALLLCCQLEQRKFQLIICVFVETTNLHPIYCETVA